MGGATHAPAAVANCEDPRLRQALVAVLGEALEDAVPARDRDVVDAWQGVDADQDPHVEPEGADAVDADGCAEGAGELLPLARREHDGREDLGVSVGNQRPRVRVDGRQQDRAAAVDLVDADVAAIGGRERDLAPLVDGERRRRRPPSTPVEDSFSHSSLPVMRQPPSVASTLRGPNPWRCRGSRAASCRARQALGVSDPWRRTAMQAVVVEDRDAGVAGLSLAELPYPPAAENDVVVRVHAAGMTSGELEWPTSWSDRAGRDRTPSIPGHEVSGVVDALGYGTTGLTVGQRVFGLTDWARNGTLAEYVAVEARNLAPLSASIDHAVAAAVPISGLTAWQALFDHGHLMAGQTVLIHGAAGAVGSIAVQLALEAGARVIGSGRAQQRETVLGLKAHAFLDMQRDRLEDVGEVDMVLDVFGGEVLDRSAKLVRSGGVLVTVAEPPRVRPDNGRAIFFVVEPDRAHLAALELRLRDGRLMPLLGAVCPLAEAASAFDPAHRTGGKTIIRIIDDV